MTHSNRVRMSRLTLGLLVALASAPAFAQSTSSSIAGQVVDASGQPVAGAQVTILHTESGTTSRVTTDANGRYTARGLRVGGPYTVTVTKEGVGADTEENVYLALDTTNSVDAQLGAPAAATNATDLGAVVVTAAASSTAFSPSSAGAQTIVTREEIEVLPSVRRSLEDYVRLDPRIVQVDKERGGIAAAGQNSRYNNIRIDGVPTNDNFGLNDSGVPALNQPIVIDWIQEFNIGVSNYDVTQGDFVGANINAVTKSGTNEFHGSVYGIYRDDDMIGEWVGDGKRVAPFSQETTWGAYLGGPLIRDRLFFFAGYEKFEREAPASDTGILGSGAANELRITQAQIDQVAATARNFGATDIGSFDPVSIFTNQDEKWIAKIDWNITDTHRAAFRYNKTEGSVLRLNNSLTTLQASSNWFTDNISFENWAAMLYSDWSENFSTEANVSYSEYRSLPQSFSDIPQVSITARGLSATGSDATILFGEERSRQSNQLEVDTWTAFVAGTFYAGDHELKFGLDHETSDVFNLFLQDTAGSYEFRNIGTGATQTSGLTNFTDGRYTRYLFQRARSGNNLDAAAQFDVGNVGLFVQDTWTVTDQLTLMFGLRADETSVGGVPAENARFRADYGFDNRVTPDGEWTIQPRVGFNFTSGDELRTQVRGGVGLFLGSAPGVWLSNSFSNPGVLVNSYDIRANNGLLLAPGALAPGAPLVPAAAVPSQLVNAMDGDFQQPTIWKGNLAIEQELPWWNLVAGAELLLSQTDRGVHYVNYAVGNPVGVLPDGRIHYWSTTANTNGRIRANCLLVNPAVPFNPASNPCRYTNAIVLTNTSKGSAQNFTVSLEKPWSNGWYAKLAYTQGHSEEVSPGTSSVALSNWQNRPVFNQNEDEANRSNYEIADRITLALSKRWNLFSEKAPFRASMFYEGRYGRPFSYVFGNDANGDGSFGNDVFYVPASPGNVAFTANSTGADREAFFNYLASNPDLVSRRGTATSRNQGTSSWRNVVDVRFTQDIPLGFGEARAQVFLDIENFGNLLNREWGQVQEAGFPYTLSVADYAGVTADGRYVFDVSRYVNETTGAVSLPSLPYRNFESRWAAQIGVRIDF
ncbi:carboxypeptidase regulatory-like domain-containing protein [Lysobacter korlensis]|uniref:Carboxypeptidase regulatory-like domain-containing protein n=1 Tax=Lysobacter korlensis TaxID=553636 RepID=A0ABV6RPJ3_9GAMM